MAELAHVRYVTAHYAQLQGLRLIPISVPFFVSALWRVGWLDWWPGARGSEAGSWFVLLLLGAVGLSYLLEAFYLGQFGDVRPLAGRSGAATLCISVVAFVALGWVQQRFQWPIPVSLLFVSAALCRLGLVEHGLRRHYLALAVGCAAFALWTATDAAPSTMTVARDLLIGFGLIVAGIGDDRVLRRSLQRIAPEDHATAL
jgi:hypothetical protein